MAHIYIYTFATHMFAKHIFVTNTIATYMYATYTFATYICQTYIYTHIFARCVDTYISIWCLYINISYCLHIISGAARNGSFWHGLLLALHWSASFDTFFFGVSQHGTARCIPGAKKGHHRGMGRAIYRQHINDSADYQKEDKCVLMPFLFFDGSFVEAMAFPRHGVLCDFNIFNNFQHFGGGGPLPGS